MTTIVRNTKIPHNPRIVKGQKRRAALDAVTPSVKGLAQRAAVLHAGIATIKAARDVAEKTGNTELAALANNPKLNKAIDAAIKRLGRDAASILRTQLANSNDDPEDLVSGQDTDFVRSILNENEVLKASGEATVKRTAKVESAAETAMKVIQRELAKGKSIEEARAAAREAVLSQHAEAAKSAGLDAAQVARIRHARFSVAQDTAAARGAYNPARVALGLPDEVPDDVYAFISDVSKVAK